MNHSATNSLNNSTNQQINISTIYWKVGILIAVFIFVYYPVILSLIRTWSARDDYSHGFLIPFISLYFVWHMRNKLRHITIKPNIIGGWILTIIGSLMLLTGYIGSVIMVQQISILIVIPGIVLTLLGTTYLKALVLPLSYLIFMIPPILDLLISNIHWPFQLFGATVAEKLINILNIPVSREVNFLQLPNMTLEVANACSGVRYLISIIAIGIPLAYYTQKNWTRRVALMSLAVAVGIIINPIRIALVGIWGYNGGKVDHGPLHIFQGLFVSVVGFISLFCLAWLFSKIPYKGVRESRTAEGEMPNRLNTYAKQFNRAWILTIIFLLSLSGYFFLYSPRHIPLKAPLQKLPLVIGKWKGEDINYEKRAYDLQGADFELNRVYSNDKGRKIKLYLGYYEFQKQDKKFIHYKLQSLYDNAEEMSIPMESNGFVQFNKTVVKEGFQNSLILYWYDQNGKIIANNYKAKFITAIDGLIHRRTNGAIIIVSGDIENRDDVRVLLDDEIEFIRNALPLLKQYLPT
jgi:EpsI family protein